MRLAARERSSTPYLIQSQADFNEFATDSNYWNDYIQLETDINLASRTYTTAVIAPDTNPSSIGFQGTVFTGNFNGNGHKILNLRINTAGADNDYLGLFGQIYGSDSSATQIKNLIIENVVLTGGFDSDNIGGLCGYNSDGIISNCHTTGQIVGGTNNLVLGGLCGYNYYGTINNCYVAGSVNGHSEVGGLCGLNLKGRISNCFAIASVYGHSWFGGLCGYNTGTIRNCYSTGQVNSNHSSTQSIGGLCGSNSYGTIKNSYATGQVTGGSYSSDYLGGLCGYNYYGTISNCYSTGSVIGGRDIFKGGFCGYNSNSSFTGCFWDINTSGMTDGLGNGNIAIDPNVLQGKTTDQMQMQSTFTDAGWDFVNEETNGKMDIWYQPVNSYPQLFWQAMAGDVNYDETVNIYDLDLLCSWWLIRQSDIPTDERLLCDFNLDAIVNFQDFNGLAGNWLNGTN